MEHTRRIGHRIDQTQKFGDHCSAKPNSTPIIMNCTFHKSWVMLDKSVVVQGLPDFKPWDSFHEVPSFGDIKLGQVGVQHIDSIQIKLFRLESYWEFSKCDAYVCITITDAYGTKKVRGFHADASSTHHDKVNSTLFVKKKLRYAEPDGCCPICMDTNMTTLHPMQAANSTCGHSVCQKCFMTSQDQQLPKCAFCRAPVPRLFDHLSREELHDVCEYARGAGNNRQAMEKQAWRRMMDGKPTYSVMPRWVNTQ